MKKTSMQGFGLFKDTSNRQHFAAGDVIFQAGDFSDSMYVVVEGELSFSLQGNEVDRMSAGDLFGEMGMVENRPRNGTVTAMTDCTLIPIDRIHFAVLIRQHPGFATRVMSVISARLHRRTEGEVKRRALERELAIGRKMQLSLLPQSTPQIPGWQFATHYQSAWQVGGDFYDFIYLEDDPTKLCLVIADVTGKGVPAALYMAVARTLIRAETSKEHSPARVLQRVNELILNDNCSPLFFSALYAVLDVETGLLRYASAGHDPPLCLRRANGEVEVLPAKGSLLGAFWDAAYSEQETVLASGDALLLYTDGISEARDAQRGFFGEERLKIVFATAGECSAEEIVRGLVTAVDEFTGSVDQADDLTLLVAKRNS
ncbi:MAG: SpoIIE family protein phosphatase [Anaerolineales bacterium]|nr:SpoIIE family protein phosphatase [Anaerolineales bacterium]